MFTSGEERPIELSARATEKWPTIAWLGDWPNLVALTIAAALGGFACLIVDVLWQQPYGIWIGIPVGVAAGTAVLQALLLILRND